MLQSVSLNESQKKKLTGPNRLRAKRLIETAKANGLEPYAYLRYLFENLPLIEDEDDYRRLLPQYLEK